MANKADLQRKLSDLGYTVGPFASKETLSNIVRLHSSALTNADIDVARLSDLELRRTLTESGVSVGPVTNHTRSIYQRKLLEVLTNEISEGQEDEIEIDVPTSTTPPRSNRSSIVRNTDTSPTSSSPGRSFLRGTQEPRIPLTRVDVDERNTQNLASFYPTLSNTKPRSDEIITNSYSSQRSSLKPSDSRNSAALRDPYDFQSDEPVPTRHEHKATPFRTSNLSAGEPYSSNTNRYTKPSDVQPTASTRGVFNNPENDISEIRARIFGKTNEQKDLSVNKKPTINNEFESKKPTSNEKLDVAVKNSGTFLYTGITVTVALVVFVVYMLLVK